MKHERCPKCGGGLGIPDKLRGQPVRCPVCKLKFVPDDILDSTDTPTSNAKHEGPASAVDLPKPSGLANDMSPPSKAATPKSNAFKRPEIRGLPVPTGLKSKSTGQADSKARLGTIAPGGSQKDDKISASPNVYDYDDAVDDLPKIDSSEEDDSIDVGMLAAEAKQTDEPAKTKPKSPKKATLPTLKINSPVKREPSIPQAVPNAHLNVPTAISKAIAKEPSIPESPSFREPSAEAPSNSVANSNALPTSAPLAPSTKTRQAQPEQQSVARIIKTENVKPQLTVDGKLPKLRLVDKADEPPVESDWKSNPAIVGLILCGSLILSGMIILLAGNESASAKQAVEDAREKITRFYEIREDEELLPYQSELRSAQLAHSAEDYRAEIRALQKVMARFRAEDRDRFKGLTGSPTWDIELQELISILLKDARRKSRF